MNIAHLLKRAAQSFPDRPALAVGTATVADYAFFGRAAAAIGGRLRDRLHLLPGDSVALVMSNHPAFMEALYGAWWGGLMPVPVNAKLHPKELAYILEDSQAKVAIVTPDLADAVGALQPGLTHLKAVIDVERPEYAALKQGDAGPIVHRDATDTAWLFYTSGTTGRPKGAMIPHRALYALTTTYFIDIDAAEPDDRILHAAPMSHGSGLYNFQHVARGACQVVPESGGFDPEEILDLCERIPALTMFGAPTMVKRLVDHAAARASQGGVGPGLKTVVFGGAPMHVPDIKRAFDVLGPRLAQLYGQGESPMTITGMTKALLADAVREGRDDRLASAGIPQTVCEVAIAEIDRADGYLHPLPAGAVGEILVRGDSLMTGYWRNPEASAKTLRGGWLHTGDVGALSPDGYLTLKDRSKDVIISGGSNIYPREVEDVLLMHPDVTEASVVGLPHPDWGEEVVAFVVARKGRTVEPATLDAICLDNIARFKRPKHYRFVDALPKNNYGKILKTELRKLLEPD